MIRSSRCFLIYFYRLVNFTTDNGSNPVLKLKTSEVFATQLKIASGDDLKGELGNYSLPLSQNENVKADCSFRTSELKVTPPGANIKVVLLY